MPQLRETETARGEQMTEPLLVSVDRDSLRWLLRHAKEAFCIHTKNREACDSCDRAVPSDMMRRAMVDAERAIEDWRSDPLRKGVRE